MERCAFRQTIALLSLKFIIMFKGEKMTASLETVETQINNHPNDVYGDFQIGVRDGSDALLWNTLRTAAGSPVARQQLIGQLVDTRYVGHEASSKVMVSRFIRRIEGSEVADRLLTDTTHPGSYHYLLLAEGQDVEAARADLSDAVALSVVANMARARKPRNSENPYRPLPPTTEEAIAEHFSRQQHTGDNSAYTEGNCESVGREVLQSKKGAPSHAAKLVCGQCAVADACLTEYLDERDGVFGGLSATERKQVRQMRTQGVAEEVIRDYVTGIRARGLAAAQAYYKKHGFDAPDSALQADIA